VYGVGWGGERRSRIGPPNLGPRLEPPSALQRCFCPSSVLQLFEAAVGDRPSWSGDEEVAGACWTACRQWWKTITRERSREMAEFVVRSKSLQTNRGPIGVQ